MKCNECGSQMIKLDRYMEMAEMDEDVTEGQMADYLASELSGDMGTWGIGIIEYRCPKCETTIEIISDDLKNLDALIERWHAKTKTGDYFEKYVFEYLAFNVFLKTHVAMQAPTDRRAIESLKQQQDPWGNAYFGLITLDSEIIARDAWLSVINELKQRPLYNSSKDYDHPEIDNYWTQQTGDEIDKNDKKEGVIYSLDDWNNMVEFWYAVRNNLFHAGADPEFKRDMFLVEHAFITLNAFMRMVIGLLKIL